jgi:nitrogen fixation NifU-like protein
MATAGGGGTLYQDLILEHSRNPRHFGPLPGARHVARLENPFCGDDITVYLELEGERICRIQFEGAACAIALAASSMMTEQLHGRTRLFAEDLARRFSALVAGELGGEPVSDDAFGPLQAFAGVARFPVRVECARLPWRALLAALAALKPDGGVT